MLTGDAGKKEIRRLIREGKDISATYLKMPHHGSQHNMNKKILSEISPEVAIMCTLKLTSGNRKGLPFSASGATIFLKEACIMRLCKKILAISLKEKSAFRFDYITGILFAFLSFVLRVYLWKGIYGSNGEAVNGIVLNDMIVYSIFAGFTEGITKTCVMHDLNDSVLNGSIASDLLLPIGLKKYMLIRTITKNILGTVYTTIPSVFAAMLFFGFHADIRFFPFLLYLFSADVGIVINFLYSFLFGLSVIWFRNSFFLNNVNSVLFNLFSGTLVPLWFFPKGLGILSELLPFRYIVFEPVSILLNKKSPEEIAAVLIMQLFWSFALFFAVTLVWNRGRHKIMIQGG